MHLPVIDLSKPSSSISQELLDAATEWGFLYVRFKDLPMSADNANNLFELSRDFYKLPRTEKEKYKIGPEDRGWSAPFGETLDDDVADDPGDFKEGFNIGEYKNHMPQQPLPELLAKKNQFLDDFQQKCRGLCLILLEHIAEALKINDNAGGKQFFSSRHAQANGKTGSILRLLYYPVHPANSASSSKQATHPLATIRCGAHTDYGSMTLLFQRPGQPGLEVETRDGKSWMPVEVFPPGTESDNLPPIVVNIGDLLQFWTRGVLKSNKHRVMIPADRTEDRFSVAYFCHPAADTSLVGVPSILVQGRQLEKGYANGEVITAGEHLRRKLDRAYGWNKESAEVKT